MAKNLNEIKHGDRIVALLKSSGPLFFNEIEHKAALDPSTAQKVVASLNRHGYVMKDAKGRWKVGDNG